MCLVREAAGGYHPLERVSPSLFPLRDSMQASLSVVWCTAIIAIFAAMTFKLYKLTDLAM